MTTHAASAGRQWKSTLAPSRITIGGVLNAEWIKLRSLRSSWFSLLAAVVIIDGLGALFSSLHDRHDQGRARFVPVDPTQVSLRGVLLAQLAIGVLGVLVVTGEYATGMIRSSLSAVPHRTPIVLAKAVVFAVVVFVVSFMATLVGFELGQLAQKSNGAQASLGDAGAFRAVFGAAIYLTLIGLMGIGLGFALRSTAGAIAGLFAIVLVAPLLTNALPSPWDADVAKYLPLTAGTRVIQTTDVDPGTLSPLAGLALVAGYASVALIVGVVALNRRDA